MNHNKKKIHLTALGLVALFSAFTLLDSYIFSFSSTFSETKHKMTNKPLQLNSY